MTHQPTNHCISRTMVPTQTDMILLLVCARGHPAAVQCSALDRYRVPGTRTRHGAALPRSPRPQMETRRAVTTDNAHVACHAGSAAKKLPELPSSSPSASARARRDTGHCPFRTGSARRHPRLCTEGRVPSPESGWGWMRLHRSERPEMCSYARPLISHELLPRCFVGAKPNKKERRIRFFSSSACFSPDIARLFRFN